jgi:hypothetical protein
MPELTAVEWLGSLETWHAEYLALIEVRRARALARINAAIERSARENPPGKAFVCVCGVEGDPFDPEYERIHRAHVFLAQFDRPR